MENTDKSGGFIVYYDTPTRAGRERSFDTKAEAVKFSARMGGHVVEKFIRANLSSYEVEL